MELHRAIQDREGMAAGLLRLSDIARDEGDAAKVQEYGTESLTILRQLGVQWAIGFALNNLALAAYQEGDLERALALVSESVALFRAQAADASLAEVLITLARIVRAQGDAAAAYVALTEPIGIARAIGPRLLVAAALEGLAGLAAQPDQATLALQLVSAAAARRAQMGAPVRPAERSAVERVLTMARATLGAERYDTVWSAAHAMPLEQLLDTLSNAGSARIV